VVGLDEHRDTIAPRAGTAGSLGRAPWYPCAMRIYRHWARAQCRADGTPDPQGDIVGIGWSDQSQHDAERAALERAQQIATMYREDRLPNGHGWYYPDRPIREPALDELRVGD